MAMPVVPYTDVTGAGRPRSVTGGTPVRATVRPPAADRRVHCRGLPRAAGSPRGGRRSVVGVSSVRHRVVVGPSSVRRRVANGVSSGCPTARYRPRRRPADREAIPPGHVRPRPVRNPPHSRRPRTPSGRHPDTRNGTAHLLRTGRGGRMEAAAPLGRAPVERMISAHATVCFQPTSFPSQSLAEMADQPPCQQAEGDRAVRFHPTGTGHERQAHFPARLTSETLRDRMLPARLPCRHKAGW